MDFERLLPLGQWTLFSRARPRWEASANAQNLSARRHPQHPVMPHSFYDGPGLLAAIHATAALGNG